MFTFIGCIFYCNFLCFQEQLKYTVFLVKKNLRWNMDKTFLLDIPKVSDWKKKKEKMKENQMMYCWICVKVNQSTWTSSLWMEYQILNHVKVSFRWQFAPSPPCAHLLHFPLTHSAPGMLASSLFIKPTRCSSTSGPWHLLLSLPGTLLLRLMVYSLTSSRFSFKYHLPDASLPWLLALLPIIHPIPSLLYFFSKNISSASNTLDIVFIHASCLSSPLEC